MKILIKKKVKLKPVVIQKPVAIQKPVVSSQDTEIEDLEEKIASALKKKKVKADKKKKYETSPHAEMKKIHEAWVKEIGTMYTSNIQYDCIVQPDYDRIDIAPKEVNVQWRLCITGLYDNSVDMNIFFIGKPDHMNPQISFLNMPASLIKDHVAELLELGSKHYESVTKDLK